MPDWRQIVQDLADAQQVEYDNRQRVREATHFVSKKDGQWEPSVTQKMIGRPKYTFDRCRIAIDDVMGQIGQSDFAVNVYPSGGEASKDTAMVRSGIIRKCERMSGARHIYNHAARKMVTTGISGWRVVQEWADSKSFHQDLLIKPVSNFEDRVWFDPGAEERDMSDAGYCFLLSSLTTADYERKYPKGSGLSVGTDLHNEVYDHKKTDEVIIGEYLWKKRKKQELVLMSNGAVYVVDDEFNMIRDEKAAQGITEVRTRTAYIDVVYQRLFDGSDWITDEKETVFQWLPVIPVFGNFDISERKVIYEGLVEPLMDAQRVLNYAESRKIEEGALAPREKLMMTKKQAVGHEQQLRTLNTNADPVQFYNVDQEAPQPYKIGGAQVNPSLTETTTSMNTHIQQTAGTFQAQRERAAGVQSGSAIERLENKENSTNYKWFQAMEVAIRHTGRVLNDALPKVYDTNRQLPVINADGSEDVVTVNERIMDQQTGEVVEKNNLAAGIYEVDCNVGPAFQNQQEQTVQLLLDAAKVNPQVMQLGGDIFLNSINSPFIEKIAERMRAQMVNANLIPPEQLTDDEKAQKGLLPLEQMSKDQLAVMVAQLAQQAQQQPDAMTIAAQAEAQKAQADLQTAQVKAADLEIKNNKLMLDAQQAQAKAQQAQQQLDLDRQRLALQAQKDEADEAVNDRKQVVEMVRAQNEQLKLHAETLKTIKDAIGADTIMVPDVLETYRKQGDILGRAQNAKI